MADPAPRHLPLALLYGALCHGTFALAGLAMVWGLFTGLTQAFGAVPYPWALLANAALLLQFPLGHSLLLTDRGRRVLARLAPEPFGTTLATTTYAFIASLQLLALFTLWTPSGIVLWQAEGAAYWLMCALFAASWLILAKASFDAGPEVQGGWLGWTALARGIKPVFPDMPQTGLFRVIRQPIYAGFALTLWTMPTWTADQVALATAYTAYCLLAPRLKERRFARFYGNRFRTYQARVPYWIPRLPNLRSRKDA
ncbi:MAG: isoprenylcysteine carboxylmethyltransferase family protein [Rhodobacter sp.]|nr:isoprenylcysteine carboxylmethyltransferase family protein [Rhodobacter sp.]